MIKNGKPCTIEDGHDDTKLISEALPIIQEKVFEWIDEFISPASRKNTNHTSYSLKHRFADWLGENEKMSNNQFKDAMLVKGYMPTNPNEVNWFYKIKVKEQKNA